MRPVALATLLLILAALAPLPAVAEQAGAGTPIARFHQVDERLYRGAQPTDVGLRRLHDLGVRTVINVRDEADAEVEKERRIVESLGMRFVHIPISDGNVFTWYRQIPEDTVKRFFEVVDAVPAPLFIHCKRGTDRTGALVAFYRIARNGWDAARAVSEANEVGMRPWYRGLRRQIETFNSSVIHTRPPVGDGDKEK
jgi:tyrosine-protein phosphatase SIW14